MVKALRLALAAVCLLAISACHSNREVIPVEALQAPAHSHFYTSVNFWYENPSSIKAPNELKGHILPFGTEISFIYANQDIVKFKSVDTGAEYTVDFNKSLMLCSMEDFLKKVFSTKSPEDFAKDLRPSTYEKLKRGVVEEGMSRDMVLLAYGYPSPTRTASIKDDTWVYWDNDLKSRRVVFKDDKVIAVFDFE